MPQRNDRVKDKPSGFEAAPDALDRFFSDAVRAFPGPSRPETDERPVLRGLPRPIENEVETKADPEPLRDEVSPPPRVERMQPAAGVGVIEAPPPPVIPLPATPRTPAASRQKSKAPAARFQDRIRWRHAAIGGLVLVGLAEVILIGWRFVARPPDGPVGALTVTSKPSGAQFLVDGDPAGITPATVKIPEGVHALEIRSGGPTQVVALRVEKDRNVSRFFDLPVGTSPATVRIDSKPTGARVLVDGRPRGRSPVTVSGLNPGQHAVRVERGSQFVQKEVMLESGASTVEALELEPLAFDANAGYGWLAVSMPVELQAYEKGRLVGTSRAGPWQLEAGSHEIEFINQSLSVRLRLTAQITEGKTTTLDVAVPSGLVSISSTAPADIQIDGETIGTAPITNRALAAGQHDIIARHAALGERRLSVTVAAGTALSVKIDFRR